MSSRDCCNYNFVVKETLRQIRLAYYADINYAIHLRTFSSDVQEKLMNLHIHEWQTQINGDSSRSGNGRDKLRTYRLFKTDYIVEDYCKLFFVVARVVILITH